MRTILVTGLFTILSVPIPVSLALAQAREWGGRSMGNALHVGSYGYRYDAVHVCLLDFDYRRSYSPCPLALGPKKGATWNVREQRDSGGHFKETLLAG